MEVKDMISWNSLISSLATGGYAMEALQFFRRMRIEGRTPDHQTLCSLVSLAEDLQSGRLLQGHTLRMGYGSDEQIRTALIVMYLKCRSVDDAFRVLEQDETKDVVIWTAMISGLVQSRFEEEALEVFNRMIRSGVWPVAETVASVLSACAQSGWIRHGRSIHGHVLRQRLATDLPADNSLITMYAKNGCLEQSRAIFDRMPEKDVISWNAIVAAYVQAGRLFHAFFLFNEMRREFHDPDFVTIITILQACASAGALHQGRWIHNFVIRNYARESVQIQTALLDMYCKSGDLRTAEKCFIRISEPDLVAWSTMIAGYSSHGRCEAALEIYGDFIRSGNKPNDVVFLSVLSACSHCGHVRQGLRIFDSMKDEFEIEPKIEHQACVVDLLCRAGRVKEAYDFFKKLRVGDGGGEVLGIILNACRSKAESDLGEEVAREILGLETVNAENYVQVGQSFAWRGRWDGVEEIWTRMRSLGLKKQPGRSSVEIKGVTTTFYMQHSSHSSYTHILFILKLLTKVMTLEPSDPNHDVIS